MAGQGERHKLVHFIERMQHHADYTTFVFHPQFAEAGQRRMRSIEDGLRKLSEQVKKIQELAVKTGNSDLLAIMGEELEILLVHN